MIRALAAVALLLSLAACGATEGPPTDVVSQTDRDRAAVLIADPLMQSVVGQPVVSYGRFRSEKVGWDRTEVRGRVYEHQPAATGAGPQPALVEVELIKVLTTLRTGGWTIYWSLCTPPPAVPKEGEELPAPVRMPPGVARDEAWQWVAFAFRVTEGVSYFALVSAELDPDSGGAWIDVTMRAPQERDPANLFADRPKALAIGKACVDDKMPAKGLEQGGTMTYLRDWWPFPGESRSADPTPR
jgi:hypothetical protein